jgi:ABC-type bacteriocin/lantibiotic exporter with double-glycine peptidase domain
MRFMGRYLRPHKKALILTTLHSLVSTGLGLVQPYFAKVLIDKVFLDDRPDLLVSVLAVLIVLLLLAFATRVANSYLYTHYSARLLFKMREDLLAHLHRIPLTFFSRSRIGDIYSHIASDMADVQQLWTVPLPHSLFDVLTCLITIVILLWHNWRIALMSFVFFPVGVIILRSIRPKLTELSRKIAESNADVAHSLFESLSGTSLIRAFGAEDLECRRLRERHAEVLQTLLRYQVVGALSGSIPTFFIVVNTLVMFGYGGFSVLGGSLSVGELVGDRGVRLSGGQRQRISIARTVLLKPKILLLDEATAFLDASVEEKLRSTLEALMQGRTILVVSHHASNIRNAKKIIALGPAGVEYEGPYDAWCSK